MKSHFEALRAKEEEAQENRRTTASAGTLGADQVATDVFVEIEREYTRLLPSYVDITSGASAGDGLRIPASGAPEIVNDLATCGVRFGDRRGGIIVNTRSLAQAELLTAITAIGPRGCSLFVPHDNATISPLLARLRALADDRLRVVETLVRDRTIDPDLVERATAKVLAKLTAGVPRARRLTALSTPAP